MLRLLPLLVTLVVLTLVGTGYWAVFLKPGGAQTGPSGPPRIVVEATRAISATSVRKLRAIGTLASNQTVMIRPEIAGRLTKIGFEDGARVEAGIELVVLDRSVLRAELKSAQASLVLAREDYARADKLLNRGTGTKQRKDEALATLRSAEAEVALAQAQMAKFTIKAPFDGTLGIRRVDVGAYLAAGDRCRSGKPSTEWMGCGRRSSGRNIVFDLCGADGIQLPRARPGKATQCRLRSAGGLSRTAPATNGPVIGTVGSRAR